MSENILLHFQENIGLYIMIKTWISIH